MFTRKEIALAHALVAEKVLLSDGAFLDENEAAIPVFLNLLFQSLEVTLKGFAVECSVATDTELRDKKLIKNGHGIQELAELIDQRINGVSVLDMLLPRRGFAESNDILRAMIFDPRFAPSRESYWRRKITYSEFKSGELQLIHPVRAWVKAVKSAAENIDMAIERFRGL